MDGHPGISMESSLKIKKGIFFIESYINFSTAKEEDNQLKSFGHSQSFTTGGIAAIDDTNYHYGDLNVKSNHYGLNLGIRKRVLTEKIYLYLSIGGHYYFYKESSFVIDSGDGPDLAPFVSYYLIKDHYFATSGSIGLEYNVYKSLNFGARIRYVDNVDYSYAGLFTLSYDF